MLLCFVALACCETNALAGVDGEGNWFPDYISGTSEEADKADVDASTAPDVVSPNAKYYSLHANGGYQGVQILDSGSSITSGTMYNAYLRYEQRARFSNNLFVEGGVGSDTLKGKDFAIGKTFTSTTTKNSVHIGAGLQFNFYPDTVATKKAVEESFNGLNFYLAGGYDYGISGSLHFVSSDGTIDRKPNIDSAHRIGGSLQMLYPVYAKLKLGATAGFFWGTYRVLDQVRVRYTYSGSCALFSALWEL